MPNDNEGPATIAPTHRKRKAKSTSKPSSKRPPPAAPTDTAASNNKKQKQFDSSLAPIQKLIESQPPAIRSLLSDTAIGLLLATQKLSSKRSGILAQRMNRDSFPRLVNIKGKFEFPTALKDDAKTIDNLHKWNEYLNKVKKKLKVQVLAQSDWTCEFLHEQRFGLFMKKIVAITEGFGAYHRQLEGAEGAPLSDQAYGAAGVYCYYSRRLACHEVFTYLGKDKKTTMAEVQAKYLVAADGSNIFHASQLRELSTFSITLEQAIATPTRLPPEVSTPVRPPGHSPMANDKSRNPLEPKEEEKEPDPQPHNPYRRVDVPLAQPTPAETAAQKGIGTEPSDAQTLELTGNARPVISRIINILFDLVPPLFLQISDSTMADQLVQKANAKLEARLKRKATLDMGQALDDSLAKEPTVAHENMEGLVQSIAQRQLKNEDKHKNNEIVKEALREARKQNFGRRKGPKNQTQKQAQLRIAKRVIEKLSEPHSASETCEEEALK
jgi:hypothetical protein